MVSSLAELRASYEALKARVEAARVRAGRRDDIRILPATKCVPPQTVALLPQIGLTEAGENRVQEFLQKCDLPLRWHFIGALQTNKVKYLVGKVALIQSVDRVPLLEELNKRSAAKNLTTDILLEVNGGGEASKSGVSLGGVEALLESAQRYAHLRVKGLMCVFPKEAPYALYEKARARYEDLQKHCASLDTLSMGMSDDYETAIQCGATMIRVGRALFGARTTDTING